MKLFISGVTGYIGHQLLLAAVNKGYEVHAFIRLSNLTEKFLHKNVHYYNGDITDFNSVVKAMKGCEMVIHAAGVAQLWHQDSSVFYKVNVEGTRNVLEAARRVGVKKSVFTSSCAVLGPSHHIPLTEDDPRNTAFENDYEISKYLAEELVKQYCRKGLFASIVCPPRVYGPGLYTQANPISKLIRDTIKRRMAFVPGNRQVIGNYAFIDDVVEGHFLALQKGMSGEKYILGGENISYEEFFQGIQQAAGKKISLISVPKTILKIASGFIFIASRLTKRHTHLSPKLIDRLFQNRAVNCEKAVMQLGYQITPFKEGLSRTIQFLSA